MSLLYPMSNQTLHPIIVERTHDLDVFGNGNTDSSSSDEESESIGVFNDSEDSDWAPDEKPRSVRNPPRRNVKSVPKQSTFILPGGSNGMPASRSEPQPEYIVNLLRIFSWRVEYYNGYGDYVYISPAGVLYFSLPNAFETFLRSRVATPKYTDVTSDSSQCFEYRRLGDNSTQWVPAPVKTIPEEVNPLLSSGKADDKTNSHIEARKNDTSNSSKLASVTTDSNGRNLVGRKISTNVDMVVEQSRPDSIGTVGNPFPRKRKGRRLTTTSVLGFESFDTPSSITITDAKRSDCDITVSPCGNVFGVRRSSRIRENHVPVVDESGRKMGTDHDCSNGSYFTAKRVVKKHEGTLSTSSFGEDYMEGRTVSNYARLGQTKNEPSDFEMINSTTPQSADAQLNVIVTNPIKEETEEKRTVVREKKPRSEKYHTSTKYFKAETPVGKKHSPSYRAKRKPAGNGYLNGKKKKRRRKSGCCLMVRRSKKNDHHEEDSEEDLSQKKVSILSWLVDSGTLSENERVAYIMKNSMSYVSNGLITREGIWCDCCKEVVSLSKFGAHTGGNLNQIWETTSLLTGKTFIQSLREAWENEKKQKKVGFQMVAIDKLDPSDDTCGVCADGGDLICCDSCPSSFHQDCLMVEALPEGSWYCPYCKCAFCAVSVDSVHGSDTANLETSMLLTCKHCKRKYHSECTMERGKLDIGTMAFFCGKECRMIGDRLSYMLGTENPIEGGFSWTLLRRLDEDEGVTSNERFSFIMKCNVKLSMALFVLNECFVPLIDHQTGVEMISQAVYNCGSNFNRLNFEGFYTLILEKDEEIMSAASLRFHGTKMAEMPFIGTRPMYRRQGMCRRLVETTENILSSLNVEKLIIPATPELLETWMSSFSFEPLELSLRYEIKNLSMAVFADTTLLQKSIPIDGGATSHSEKNLLIIDGDSRDRKDFSPEPTV